jgi:hypothetical protein
MIKGKMGAQINELSELLTTCGKVMPQGRAGTRRHVPGALGRLPNRLSAMVIETLRERYARLEELDEQSGRIKRRPCQWQREDSATQRIVAIPSAGLLSATTDEWLAELMKRRAKNSRRRGGEQARTIFALKAHERAHQTGYVSRPAWGCTHD